MPVWDNTRTYSGREDGSGGDSASSGNARGGFNPFTLPTSAAYSTGTNNGFLQQLMGLINPNMAQYMQAGDAFGSQLQNFYDPSRMNANYSNYRSGMGDVNSGYNNLQGQLGGHLNSYTGLQGQYDRLGGQYAGLPGQYGYMDNSVAGLGGAVGQGGQMWDTMFGNLNYLNQYGLPGSQGLQGDQSYGSDGGRNLLGGGGTYGVQDLLSQIMTQGLPNQRGMENLFQGQSQLGTSNQSKSGRVLDSLGGRGLQQDARDVAGNLLKSPLRGASPKQIAAKGVARPDQITADYGSMPGSVTTLNQAGTNYLDRNYKFQTPEELRAISGLSGRILNQKPTGTPAIQNKTIASVSQAQDNGGLTDSYVKSMRNKVLEPTLEKRSASNNAMGGGVASMDSGLFQELNRRDERDFNDDLIVEGYKNYSKALDQGGQLGGQAFDQGLSNNKQETTNVLGAGAMLSDVGKFGGNQGLEGARLGIDAAKVGGDMLGQGAGYEADYYGRLRPQTSYNTQLANQDANQRWGEFGSTQDYNAQAANQGANQRANEFDINSQLNSYDLGSKMSNSDYANQLGLANAYDTRSQNAFGNAFSSFNDVAKSAYPYIDSASRTGLGMMDQANRNFDSTSNRGMQNLDMIARLGSMPLEQQQLYGDRSYTRGMNSLDGSGRALAGSGSALAGYGNTLDSQGRALSGQSTNNQGYAQLLDSLLRGGQSAYDTQSRTGLGRAGLGFGMGSDITRGEYGLEDTRLRGQTAADIARAQGTGSSISQILAGLLGGGGGGGNTGGILGSIFGGGGGFGGTPPFSGYGSIGNNGYGNGYYTGYNPYGPNDSSNGYYDSWMSGYGW